jgi:hypothetical protein
MSLATYNKMATYINKYRAANAKRASGLGSYSEVSTFSDKQIKASTYNRYADALGVSEVKVGDQIKG